MNAIILSLLLIFLAGFFQGTFGLGMKKYAPLSWEAFWLIYVVLGMIIVPFIWVSIVIPDVFEAVFSLESGNMMQALVFGGLWGLGAIMFGLAINYIGVALVYGITMGLAAALGSLLPLAAIPDIGQNPAVPYIFLGIIILLVGITILTIAGVKRDSFLLQETTTITGIKQGKWFRLGVLFSILNGVFAALLNVGFTKALPAAKVAEAQGATTQNASLAAWMTVLFGGFVINIIYSLYQLFKNKSFITFLTKDSYKGILWATGTATLFFAALGLYGQGAAVMGELGPVIGWPMFLGLALIISSIWGIVSGEWKGARKPLRLMLTGDAVLIGAWIILGYANSLI